MSCKELMSVDSVAVNVMFLHLPVSSNQVFFSATGFICEYCVKEELEMDKYRESSVVVCNNRFCRYFLPL